MPSDATNQSTVEEWEELGFFYDVDDENKQWIFIGSRSGLSNFPRLLSNYVADSRNEMISEHEHYGPYMYLKVVTLEVPEIGGRYIGGPLQSLAKLGELFEKKLSSSTVGYSFQIGPEFCDNPEYRIGVIVKEDGFHPAMADAGLTEYIERTNCL